MTQIVPAVLATSKEEYLEKLQRLKSSEIFQNAWIQLDLMDGKFVPNKSIDSQVIKNDPPPFKIEAHLMVEDPYPWVVELINLTARFIIPIELNKDLIIDLIGYVRAYSRGDIGLSLNPNTPVEKLKEFLDVIDSCLIMGVEPGFSGQEFIPETLKKIKDTAFLRKENNLDFLIGVDGGINETNADSVANAGADYLVLGSHIFEGDIRKNVEKIKKSLWSEKTP